MSYDRTPWVGVSFERRWERTGIAVVERKHVGTGEKFIRSQVVRGSKFERLTWVERLETQYHVRHLERHGPGVMYSKVNRRLVELVKELDQDLALILDVTGTGRPVWDLLRGHAKVVFKVVKMVRNGGIRV
jgi:hypothetical protein